MSDPPPTRAHPLPLAADTLVDGYRIQRLVGEGAMGQVYLAQDLLLGRPVALKLIRSQVLRPGSEGRFIEEARTTARFSHPNIVAVHAAGSYQGLPYLALEFVDGESLRMMLSRGPVPLPDALKVTRAIAEAIAEAHRQGVVHADLKPENVLLPPDGRLRVVDFGLARYVGASHTAASGTPAYMAPERWTGAPVTPAVDLWALGIILHELLTGSRPLKDAELGAYVFKPAPLPIPSVLSGTPFAQLLARCLAADPLRRPSAEEMARALGGETPAAPARSPFRGLLPFAEEDAEDFFGREEETSSLAELLRHSGLGLVIGPSGIGKSSLLGAGLARRLRTQGTWVHLSMRPGPTPLARLAALVEPDDPAELASRLRHDLGELVRALRERARSEGGKLLLTLDAYEEVFTLSAPEEADQLAAVLGAAAGADAPWRIVLAVRDDYLGKVARQEPLRRHLATSVVLGPLSASSLASAITGPLGRTGFTLDDEQLVEQIVREVSGNPAALPLVQFTCQSLWEGRDLRNRQLLASVYQSIGGVAGALATHAQRVLQRLPPDQLPCARALLLRLVTAEGTRHPRSATELVEGLGDEAAAVRDFLVAERLLTVTRDPQDDHPSVELAHDALCQQWPQLARWLAESREDHALSQELEAAAALWSRRGCREDETWSGAALTQALDRARVGLLPLTDEPRRFLEAGQQRALRGALRRRLSWAAAISVLGVVAASSVVAALEFREREQEAVRQQHEIRLAAADIGRVDLILVARDLLPASGEWIPAPLPRPPRWHLAPAEGSPGPYEPPELTVGPPTPDGAGGWRWRVEAPSREAWLTVERGDCPPSRLRLRSLPGYANREQQPSVEVRVAIPSCHASYSDTVEIPAGPYLSPRGSKPSVPVELPAYRIDRTEVTNAQFRLYATHASLTRLQWIAPPTKDEYRLAREPTTPVAGVDAFESADFCAFMGKDIPTLEEWRKAFRGGLHLDAAGKMPNPDPERVAPWGEHTGKPPTNLDQGDPFPGLAPVSSFPRDRSPYGVLDLAGNVAEWTANPSTGLFPGLRQVVGGRWDSPPEADHWHIQWLNNQLPRLQHFAVGIRCVSREQLQSIIPPAGR